MRYPWLWKEIDMCYFDWNIVSKPQSNTNIRIKKTNLPRVIYVSVCDAASLPPRTLFPVWDDRGLLWLGRRWRCWYVARSGSLDIHSVPYTSSTPGDHGSLDQGTAYLKIIHGKRCSSFGTFVRMIMCHFDSNHQSQIGSIYISWELDFQI